MGICATPVYFDFLRAVRLDAAGNPLPGDNSVYVSTGITFGVTVETEQGQQIQRRLGNGAFCLDIRGEDRITGVTLTTALCNLDFEQLELLTGGTLFTTPNNGDDVPVAFALPGIDADTPDGVGIEAWVRAMSGGGRVVHPISGKAAWFRFVIPKVTWVIDGELSFGGEDATDTTLRGVGAANPQWDTGPLGEHPSVGNSPMMIFLDDEDGIPTPECSYQALAS